MTILRYPGDSNTNFFTGPPKAFNHSLSIQHWQLRDLICCPEGDKELYYVNQHSVNCLNTTTGSVYSVLKYLTYAPTSITVSHGYLAVGGQKAQLTIKQLNSEWSLYTSVGGNINNSLSIFSNQGRKKLLVCNNDQTIKIYSLPDFQKLETLEFPTAVNHASVSPDGTKMVAVGDSNEIFLYNIRGNTFERISVFQGASDSGFSTAWNHSSERFATAAQDGYVMAWDLRQSRSIAKFFTQQSGAKGAARCVKFSPKGSIDLLMYSEHQSYFNVVDARTFNTKQVIRAAPENLDQDISGICFAPNSRSIFCGLTNSIQMYNIDTKTRRTFAEGSIN